MSRPKWVMTTAILLMLLLGGCAHANRVTAKDLVGVWHAMPYMAARWAERYVFFADGTFRFAYNQADGENRTTDFTGRWRVEKTQLVLTIVKRTVIEGGELVEAGGGSIATEFCIINGTEVQRIVDPPQQSTRTLGLLETDQSSPYHTTLKIGGQQFWKWSDDPTIDVDR